MTTIYTQPMLEALQKAYASGTSRLVYEGKEITYRSLAEMEKAISVMQRALNADAGVTKSKQVRMSSRTGL